MRYRNSTKEIWCRVKDYTKSKKQVNTLLDKFFGFPAKIKNVFVDWIAAPGIGFGTATITTDINSVLSAMISVATLVLIVLRIYYVIKKKGE